MTENFKVKTLVVGKGQTTGDEKAGRWSKRYYELELSIEDEHQLELAKATAESLIDSWLGTETSEKAKPKDLTKLPFDVGKIQWQDKTNENGQFQMSEDFNSLDHKELLKFLADHTPGKCVNSKDSQGQTWFYWTYPNGSTIGRKQRK